jgi:hypothetical protein
MITGIRTMARLISACISTPCCLVCIIRSIDLDVNDFSTTEDKIVVHKGPIDPDAVIAPGHGIGRDLRVMLDHIVINLDHFQWVKVRMDCDITHD